MLIRPNKLSACSWNPLGEVLTTLDFGRGKISCSLSLMRNMHSTVPLIDQTEPVRFVIHVMGCGAISIYLVTSDLTDVYCTQSKINHTPV